MTDEREVITQYRRDLSSGMVHAVVIVNGQPMSAEADNQDDAGAYSEITEEQMRATARDHRCKRCIPEDWPAL